MDALLSILNNELADGRTTLSAAGHDIEAAASFFKDNYTNSPKETKLENTMALATQSLGTVAYHINRLAKNFVDAIEMQSNLISDISERIGMLRMTTNIHQEKVARKSIGACSTQKLPIIFQHDQLGPEPPQKYIRRPIDYSVLDSVGHGVHMQDLTGRQYDGAMIREGLQSSGSVRQHQTVSARAPTSNYNSHYAAAIHNDNRFQSNTVGRTAGIYRAAVVPPQHLMSPISNSGSGSLSPAYAPADAVLPTLSTAMNMPPPPTSYNNQHMRSSDSSSVGSGAAYHATQYMANEPRHNIYSHQQQHIPPIQMQLNQQHMFPSSTPMISQPNPGVLNYVQQQQQHQQQQQPPFTQIQPQQRTGLVETGISHVDVQRPLSNNPRFAQPAAQTSDMMDQMTLPPPEAYAGSTYAQQYNNPTPTGSVTVSTPMGNDECATNGAIRRQPNDPAWAPDFYLEKVVTLYDYEQTREDELTFSEDQIIYVVKKNDDDWWEGVMDGVTGLFPGNYVERVE